VVELSHSSWLVGSVVPGIERQPRKKLQPNPDRKRQMRAPPPRNRWFVDSPLEGNGFEISVPRQIGSGFVASVGLGPIDSRRGGGITRAVVGLAKPIELFRRLKEPPLTRRI